MMLMSSMDCCHCCGEIDVNDANVVCRLLLLLLLLSKIAVRDVNVMHGFLSVMSMLSQLLSVMLKLWIDC